MLLEADMAEKRMHLRGFNLAHNRGMVPRQFRGSRNSRFFDVSTRVAITRFYCEPACNKVVQRVAKS